MPSFAVLNQPRKSRDAPASSWTVEFLGASLDFPILSSFDDANGCFQPEGHQGLGRNLHGMAFGQDLSGPTGACAGQATDNCALTSAGNCTDDSAEGRAATNEFSRSFVFPDAFTPLLPKVG